MDVEYRVVKDGAFYAIQYVGYWDDVIPDKNPYPVGNTLEGLRESYNKFGDAFNKPILELKNGRLVEVKP